MNYYCIYLFSMFFQTNEKTKEFQQNINIQKKSPTNFQTVVALLVAVVVGNS